MLNSITNFEEIAERKKLLSLFIGSHFRSKVKPSESRQSEVKSPDRWNDSKNIQGK